MAETRSKIATVTTTAVARRPADVFAVLDQWRDRNLQALNEAIDAILARLHHDFDQATIERDRIAEVTARQRPPRAKPKPTILDAEVALAHELANLVGVASQLHQATLDVERLADVAMVGAVRTAREVERQDQRMLPAPPAYDWDTGEVG